MALIGFTGFETGDTREYASLGGTGGGNSGATIVSNIKRTGDYALRINPSNAAVRIISPDYGNGFSAYITFYFYVASMPSSANTIAMVGTGAAGTRIQVNGSGSVTLYNGTSSSGSAGTVTTETWNRIDYKHVDNGTCELSLNGGSTVSITAPDLANHFLFLGSRLENATYDIYYDDVVIDDAQFWGTPQIVRMDPDGDGTDATGFTGGTGTTYAEVDEVPPDDLTTLWEGGGSTGNARGVTLESAASAGVEGDIYAVKPTAVVRSSGSSATMSLRLRHGSDVDDTPISLPAFGAWGVVSAIYLTDIDVSGGAWVESDLDALQVAVVQGTVDGSGPFVTALYLMVLSAGPSLGPEIDDVDPDTLAHGDTFTVTGSGFGATQGSGAVVISPTDDVEDGDAVSITNVGTWADDELTDVVFDQGGINPGSAYLFVVNDDGDANEDGIPITIVPVEIEVSDSLSVAVGDAAQAADTITASDTLSVALTEAMAIVEALTAEDTLSVAITEGESTLLDFEVIEVSDTLSLALEETAEAVVTIEHFSVTDTLSLAVTDEAATAFDAITASDSLVVVVSDASQAAELLTATDTLVVVLTEGAATFLEEIHVTDTLSLAITDAIQAADTIALADTLSLALQDSSAAMELWTASDTLSLAITESSSVRILPVYHVPSRLINDPPRAAHRPVRPSVQAAHTPSRLEEDA